MNRNHTSLETAIKLKAAGFPQTTQFAWRRSMNSLTPEPFLDQPVGTDAEGMIASAPGAQELADELPRYATVAKTGTGYESCLLDDPSQYDIASYICEADTIVEALAKLYLKLATHQPTEQEGRV